jgi:hypothetical protein
VQYTSDRDFVRFPGLRWVNPLLESWILPVELRRLAMILAEAASGGRD